jgi:hypothetical protein
LTDPGFISHVVIPGKASIREALRKAVINKNRDLCYLLFQIVGAELARKLKTRQNRWNPTA